jgi:hypothetical protein
VTSGGGRGVRAWDCGCGCGERPGEQDVVGVSVSVDVDVGGHQRKKTGRTRCSGCRFGWVAERKDAANEV